MRGHHKAGRCRRQPRRVEDHGQAGREKYAAQIDWIARESEDAVLDEFGGRYAGFGGLIGACELAPGRKDERHASDQSGRTADLEHEGPHRRRKRKRHRKLKAGAKDERNEEEPIEGAP